MITLGLLEETLKIAKAEGAEGADIQAYEGEDRSAGVRFGEVEDVSSSRDVSFMLRVFRGGKMAAVSTSDISSETLREVAKKACGMLDFADEDEAFGLADAAEHPWDYAHLNLYDPAVSGVTIEHQLELARRMERAAFDFDPRVVNQRKCGAGISWGTSYYGSSHGFLAWYPWTSFACGIELVAEENGMMQSGRRHVSNRYLNLLSDPCLAGELAAKEATRLLGSRKVATGEVPVVFSPDAARSFLREIAMAVSGGSLYRKASFLYGKRGERVAAPILDIIDDPLITGGLGSRPFDGEGVRSRRTEIVHNGVLNSYLLDVYSARKLGEQTTGHKNGPSNLVMLPAPNHPGIRAPEAIIASVKSGLYVVDTMGFGVDLVSGSYSKGVRGIWIENGELAYPVGESTIAGNLADMLMDIEMMGMDGEFDYRLVAPTLKIAKMTVAGK